MLQNFQFWTKLHCNNYKATLYFFEKIEKLLTHLQNINYKTTILDRIKLDSKPSFPKTRMKPCKSQKRQFSIVDFGERLGAGVYKFAIYFVQECRSYLRIRRLK